MMEFAPPFASWTLTMKNFTANNLVVFCSICRLTEIRRYRFNRRVNMAWHPAHVLGIV